MTETLITNNGANWWEQLQKNVYAGAKELWNCVQQHVHLSMDKIQPEELKPKTQQSMYRHSSAHRPRQFEACVFCALQLWTEELGELFIAGPKFFMKSPASVAALLDFERYAEKWTLIPREELLASSVDLPHKDALGNWTSTPVLMHRRRVPPSALSGETPV